jgi:polysaccharide pyruvyl transferase WcaK-like protein
MTESPLPLLSRRQSIGQLGLLLASVQSLAWGAARRPRILLRSSWQTVNIGDIAHTPGVLHLLEQHLPEADIVLWPSNVGNGVEEILRARFPKLEIAKTSADREAAFASCDFLLHGSGPSLVAQKDVIRWREETGKPYGIYGITVGPQGSTATSAASGEAVATTINVLSGAAFVYFRDSHSLAFAKAQGCTAPTMAFGPDGAFACDLQDNEKAEAFLSKNGLEEGKFLCLIPRLRYTPYWTIPAKKASLDPVKDAYNKEWQEHDHAPHRAAIEQVLAATDLKILLCPEDQTQMQVGKELILDRLPASSRERVVWKPDYWLTGEALSTYRRSAGLFGNEMHSPIMCIGQGIPAIVCRWAAQTTKGYMWDDIGLGDWLFDFDKDGETARLPAAVLAMAQDPDGSKQKALAARDRVHANFRDSMGQLGAMLG